MFVIYLFLVPIVLKKIIDCQSYVRTFNISNVPTRIILYTAVHIL